MCDRIHIFFAPPARFYYYFLLLLGIFFMVLTPETIVLGLETFNVVEFKPVVIIFHDCLQLRVSQGSSCKIFDILHLKYRFSIQKPFKKLKIFACGALWRLV